MSTITRAKPKTQARRRSSSRISTLVDRLAEEFGPKAGEKQKAVGAVDLLIKLRRSKA